MIKSGEGAKRRGGVLGTAILLIEDRTEVGSEGLEGQNGGCLDVTD